MNRVEAERQANWPPAPNPIISIRRDKCPVCNNMLRSTGFYKLIHPPFKIMACSTCYKTYWQKTEPDQNESGPTRSVKPRHPYEVADRECETKTGALESQGNDLTPRPAQPSEVSPEQRQAARANGLMGLDEFIKHIETHKVDRTIVLNKVPLEQQVSLLRSQVLLLMTQVDTLTEQYSVLSKLLSEHTFWHK